MELAELKKRLRQAGFEVYRAQDGHVTLAERVRDNLILDSGIAVCVADGRSTIPGGPSIRLTIRAQASHFPGQSADQVHEAAHHMASTFRAAGYSLEDERAVGVPHPSDPEKVIDTTHEVVLRLAIEDLDLLPEAVRFAFSRKRASIDD